jgi:hypothetical protein
MELPGAVDFARSNRQSVLTTIRRDGRPQLSNVYHHVFDDGIIRIIGEHDDWDAYREGVVAERRSIVRFTPDRAYGMLELPARTGS